MIVEALFTRDGGAPATGLALDEIELSLYARAKAAGTVTQVWTAEHPTEEVGGGIYTREYASEDPAAYTYFACAHYTGAESLDATYALQQCQHTDSDAMWNNATRTLTQPAAAAVGSGLDIVIGATFEATISGLTIPANWARLYWTVKTRASEPDTSAIVQVKVSNPAAGTDGLLRVQKVAGTAAQGSLTVSVLAGTVELWLADEATALLHAREDLVYDVKALLADGSSEVLTTGTGDASEAVTGAV